MFNAELFRQMIDMLPLYVGESVFSCLYVAKFLSARFETKPLLILWLAPSVALDELLFALVPNTDPWHDSIWIAARIFLLVLLQKALFAHREGGMHAFLIASILAVVYLTKYLVAMPFTAISDLVWGHAMPYLLNRGFLNGMLTTYGTKLFVTVFSDGMVFFLNGAWGAICIFLMLRTLDKAYTRKQDFLENTDAVFLCAPCVSCVAICYALLIILRKENSKGNILFYNDMPYMRLFILIICVMLLFTIYVAIVLFQQQLARRDDVRIAAMQDAHITQLSAEISDLTEIYSDLRSLRHDMNNHIENLSALFISSSSASEIQDYLDRMRDTADRLSLSYSTGNPVCDIIIHRKKTAAVSMGLSFECDLTFPDDSMLDAYDVGVILDNALDNALEATPHRNNDNLHGFIHIRSYQRSRLYFIEVKNPFSGEIEIDPKTYLPKSIKHDPSNHGLGLTTIRRIAEKYHGSAQCDISCLEGANIFTLTVMLRLK